MFARAALRRAVYDAGQKFLTDFCANSKNKILARLIFKRVTRPTHTSSVSNFCSSFFSLLKFYLRDESSSSFTYFLIFIYVPRYRLVTLKVIPIFEWKLCFRYSAKFTVQKILLAGRYVFDSVNFKRADVYDCTLPTTVPIRSPNVTTWYCFRNVFAPSSHKLTPPVTGASSAK